MNDIQSLCVYCASAQDIDPAYKEAARQTGQYCAEQGIEIVYGGGHVGLMGIVADTALNHNGKVTGVIPEFLVEREIGHAGVSKMIITQTIQERQAKMADLADAFLILPGGLGTLAEFFEILTWKQLGLHDKPIYIWNIEGYWTSLFTTMEQAFHQGFLRQHPGDLVQVITDIDQIS